MAEQTGMHLCGLLNLGERADRQKAIQVWTNEAFGAERAYSLPHRGLRLLEEALELAQSCGCDREKAHQLVDYIFDRPKGDLAQEMGGVGVTLLALAAAAGCSADLAGRAEVDRVLRKPLEHFRRRNQQKHDAGF